MAPGVGILFSMCINIFNAIFYIVYVIYYTRKKTFVNTILNYLKYIFSIVCDIFICYNVAKGGDNLPLSYNRLWKLLIDKNLKKTDLKQLASLSPNTLAKLGKNEVVDMQSLIKICESLQCDLSDIIEYTPEPTENRPSE